MVRWVALLALLIWCATAEAQTGTPPAQANRVWSPTANDRNVGTWQCANPTTRVLSGTAWNSATITTFQQVPANGNVFRCSVPRNQGAGAGCDGPGPGIYDAEGFAPKSQALLCTPPPPSCPPPQPAQESRVSLCPSPLVGEWTQTRTYSCSAPNWVAGPWLPADPPAGVCAEPPPQGYAPEVPRIISVAVTNNACVAGTNIYSPFFPQWLEAQKLGSTEWIRSSEDLVSQFTCAELGITEPGQPVMVRFRAVNNFGQSRPTGFWPVLIFGPEPSDINTVDREQIDYLITKNRSESYTFVCPIPPDP